jgi:hypothetical protein
MHSDLGAFELVPVVVMRRVHALLHSQEVPDTGTLRMGTADIVRQLHCAHPRASMHTISSEFTCTLLYMQRLGHQADCPVLLALSRKTSSVALCPDLA